MALGGEPKPEHRERVFSREPNLESDDYYERLGLARNANEDQIKAAFRALSKKYHPDTPGGDIAKAQNIGQAYEALGDPEKRTVYDREHPPPRLKQDAFGAVLGSRDKRTSGTSLDDFVANLQRMHGERHGRWNTQGERAENATDDNILNQIFARRAGFGSQKTESASRGPSPEEFDVIERELLSMMNSPAKFKETFERWRTGRAGITLADILRRPAVRAAFDDLVFRARQADRIDSLFSRDVVSLNRNLAVLVNAWSKEAKISIDVPEFKFLKPKFEN